MVPTMCPRLYSITSAGLQLLVRIIMTSSSFPLMEKRRDLSQSPGFRQFECVD